MKTTRCLLTLLAMVLMANVTLQAQTPVKTDRKEPVVLTETKMDKDWEAFQAAVREKDPAELSPEEKARLEDWYNRLVDKIDDTYHHNPPQAQTKAPLSQVSTSQAAVSSREVRF